MPLTDSLAVRAVYSQLVSPGIYKNIQTGNTVGEEDDSQLMITLGFNNGGKLTGSLRYVNFNNKAYGILEPGQSKPGSADVYVEGCPQASSWWYNWDGDPTCSRLSAISGFAATEADYPNGSSVLTNYDPKYAHALAADESEDITRETLIANIKYDFGAFDANLIISDRTVEEDAVTDWARIDMDDYVPAPLIVDGDKYYEDTTEFVVQRYLEAVDHPDLQRDVEDIFGAAFYYKDFVSQRNGHLADTPPEDLSHMYESLLSDLMPVASTGRSFIQKNASIVAQVRK